ncbi:MAG: hypothetical protein OXH68_00390 [Gammaproteobacteria bacterium]|nr:hypothetical protein [Gammaproteobacteria bacterium]
MNERTSVPGVSVRRPCRSGVIDFGVRSFRHLGGRLVAVVVAAVAISVDAAHDVPWFPSAADRGRQGFVRIINHASREGTIRFFAVDDDGNRIGPRELSIDANEVLHFTSDDLETGNAEKGLDVGTGSGNGDWRLEFASDLDIEVLAYVRSGDGLLASMHEVVGTGDDDRHRLALFNPAGTANPASRLRIVNAGDPLQVTINGIDDEGSPSGEVVVSVSGGASRTLAAHELESGGMFDGALGDGEGQWRLSVSADGPITVMNLLEGATGQLVNLGSTPITPDASGVHRVPLFPGTSDASGRRGLVRVINRSDRSGSVAVDAVDDSGADYEPVTLMLGPHAAVQFDANDLETGNPDLGFTAAIGPGSGDWRLNLSSDLAIEVLSFVRTDHDGFLTPMHPVAPAPGYRHRVAIFNPASNPNEVSRLRLENSGPGVASLTITGVDDLGTSPGRGVGLTVPAGQTRTLTAQELEPGSDAFEGELGDGTGKWRLSIEADGPIQVMNLLASSTGHLTSLATVPTNFAPANASAFDDRVVGKRLVEAGGDSYIDFVSTGRYRETRDGQAVLGGYVYERSGAAAATIEIDPDDGEACTIELTFESRIAGRISPCDAATASPWRLLVPSRPANGGVAYEITAMIATLPPGTWTPDVARDAEVILADDAVRIEFANGGYVDVGEHRYTCWDVAGCVIEDGILRSGRIRQTSSVPLWDFELLEDNQSATGLAYANGAVYVLDSADRKVYAYDGSGHIPALSFDLAADTHTAVGITFGDDRFYVVDELDFFEQAPRKVFVYDWLGLHLEDADFELDTAIREPRGLGYANRRLFFADAWTRKVYAYSTTGERDPDADFDLDADNRLPRGIAHDGDRFYVVDIFDDKVYAYRENGDRDADRDFELAGGNGFARGIEVIADEFYVVDSPWVFVYPADRPDLVVDGVSVDDARPGPGESLDLGATVRNIGHRRSAPTTFSFYLSTDAHIGSADQVVGEAEVEGLGPGTTVRAVGEFKAPTTSGRHYYGACVVPHAGEIDLSNCSGAVLVTVPIDSGGATEGFILDADNENATGIAYVDGRFFVVDSEDHKVYAYRTNAQRDAARDFELDADNTGAEAIVYANEKYYVADRLDDKVYVYTATGEREADADFDLADDNANPNGIAYGNDRFYIADLTDKKVYVYRTSGERVRSEDFLLARFNDTPWAMEFVDDRLYVVDNTDDRVYVYDLSGDRHLALEFPLAFDNASPEGIVLFDNRFYVPDHWDDKVYGYAKP